MLRGEFEAVDKAPEDLARQPDSKQATRGFEVLPRPPNEPSETDTYREIEQERE